LHVPQPHRKIKQVILSKSKKGKKEKREDGSKSTAGAGADCIAKKYLEIEVKFRINVHLTRQIYHMKANLKNPCIEL